MAEFFGRESEYDKDYSYAIKKGNRPPAGKRKYPFNASGDYENCCMAATGDELLPEEGLPAEQAAPETVNSSVQSMQTWQYVKTALALVGAWVVVKFLFSKT